MFTSTSFSSLISKTWMKDSKYYYHPFTYKFNLNELQPSLGEHFSYFTQASWSEFSSNTFNHSVGSSTSLLPVVHSSSTELIPNERTSDYNWMIMMDKRFLSSYLFLSLSFFTLLSLTLVLFFSSLPLVLLVFVRWRNLFFFDQTKKNRRKKKMMMNIEM